MNPFAFVVMLFAYIVVEYILREKLNLLYRSGIIVGITLIGLFNWERYVPGWFIMPFLAATVYFFVSFIYERLKIETKGYEFRNFSLFILAQVIGIFLISTTFGGITYPTYSPFFDQNNLIGKMQNELIILIVVANIWLAPQLIRCILHDLVYRTCKARAGENSEEKQLVDQGAYHAGTVIGILERLLIIASVLFTGGNPSFNVSFIGFILGTKSLARFKKFGDDEFVEYFIVGTLTSVLFALVSLWPLQLM